MSAAQIILTQAASDMADGRKIGSQTVTTRWCIGKINVETGLASETRRFDRMKYIPVI